MCVNNSHMQEIFLRSIPLYDEVLTQPIHIEDGYGTPPQGRGGARSCTTRVLKKYPPQDFIPVESEPYRAF